MKRCRYSRNVCFCSPTCAESDAGSKLWQSELALRFIQHKSKKKRICFWDVEHSIEIVWDNGNPKSQKTILQAKANKALHQTTKAVSLKLGAEESMKPVKPKLDLWDLSGKVPKVRSLKYKTPSNLEELIRFSSVRSLRTRFRESCKQTRRGIPTMAFERWLTRGLLQRSFKSHSTRGSPRTSLGSCEGLPDPVCADPILPCQEDPGFIADLTRADFGLNKGI